MSKKPVSQPQTSAPAKGPQTVGNVNPEETKAKLRTTLGILSAMAMWIPGQIDDMIIMVLQQIVGNTDAVEVAINSLKELGLIGQTLKSAIPDCPAHPRDCCHDEKLFLVADSVQLNAEAMFNNINYLRACGCDPCPPCPPCPEPNPPTPEKK